MKYRQINIDFDVHKEIEKRRISFNDTPNDVLRKVFRLSKVGAKIGDDLEYSKDLILKNIRIPDGLKLQKSYKGKLFKAEIKDGKIELNGQQFDSPSAAAIAITETSVNGWVFWDYYDKGLSKWVKLSKLRQRKTVSKSQSNNRKSQVLKIIKTGESNDHIIDKDQFKDNELLLIASNILNLGIADDAHRYSIFGIVQCLLANKSEEQLQGVIERSNFWNRVGDGKYTLSVEGLVERNALPKPSINISKTAKYLLSRKLKNDVISAEINPNFGSLKIFINNLDAIPNQALDLIKSYQHKFSVNSSSPTRKVFNWIIQDNIYKWKIIE